jgi:hypothetical protein
VANNVTIPATGTGGTANPAVETIDTTGTAGAQRQVVRISRRLNPTSTLMRPANTIAYGPGQLIASGTIVGSVVVPTLTAALLNGMSGVIKRVRLWTNATSGMDGVLVGADLWTAAPTFNIADRGVYGLSGSTPGVATGAASWLARIPSITFRQVGDGAFGEGVPNTEIWFVAGGSVTTLWWTLFTASGFTPISTQTFTLITELLQD